MVESSDKGPTIKITVNGYEQIFTVNDLRQMPELRYADLYAVCFMSTKLGHSLSLSVASGRTASTHTLTFLQGPFSACNHILSHSGPH